MQTIQQLDLQLCSAESAHEEGDKHNFARKGRTIWYETFLKLPCTKGSGVPFVASFVSKMGYKWTR